MARIEDIEIDTAIFEAEAELAHNGKLFDAQEALSSLREKYFR